MEVKPFLRSLIGEEGGERGRGRREEGEGCPNCALRPTAPPSQVDALKPGKNHHIEADLFFSYSVWFKYFENFIYSYSYITCVSLDSNSIFFSFLFRF